MNFTLYGIVRWLIGFEVPHMPIVIFFWVVLGSILADIDHKRSLIGKYLIFPFWTVFNGERSQPHSLIAAILIALPVYMYNNIIGYIFFGSYMGHLLMDTLTPMGVAWFYPFDYYFTLKWDMEYPIVGLCLVALTKGEMWRYLIR